MPCATLCVCVPARNEQDRLPVLLRALALQTDAPRFSVVIALNNTTDGSRQAIEDTRRGVGFTSDIVIDEIEFPEALAHAGSARRRAMDLGADIAGPRGILLTTDADARPPPEWVAQNVRALDAGLDIVGGRIALDDREPVGEGVRNLAALQDRYWARVRDIEDAIDPVPWDPPPRHGDHTGASLGMTVAAYRKAGGVPVIASSEDRALVKAVLRTGGRLAHPAPIWTFVSPRTRGRAAEGMAEAMNRLHLAATTGREVRLPHFSHWRDRAECRKRLRASGGAALVAEMEDGLPEMPCDMIVTENTFSDASAV